MNRTRPYFLLLCCAAAAQAQYLATVVAGGGGGVSANANGAQATDVPLDQITGVAVDPAGNVYAADAAFSGSQLILRISPTGVLTIVAGVAGAGGYSGDGGPATGALLNTPAALALDGAGNLYFADSGNNRIRRVDPNGTISTVAGNGVFADPSTPVSGAVGDGAAATLATLNAPFGVAVDNAGTLFLSDTANCRIRKVDADGNISTIAGTGQCGYSGDNGPAGSAQLNFPHGLAFDAAGNLYIADYDNHRIRRVDLSGRITTVAGTGSPGHAGNGGLATNATLDWPTDAVPDNAGNLYIADSVGKWKVAPDGTIAIFAPYAPLAEGLAVDPAGDVFLALYAAVWKVRVGGQYVSIAGSTASDYDNGTPAIDVSLQWTTAIVAAPDGGFYFASFQHVYRVSAQGIISTVAGNGVGAGNGDGRPAISATLGDVVGLALDSAGNLYISDQDGFVRKVTAAGIINTVAGTGAEGFSGDGGPSASAQMSVPQGVAVDAAGNLYIADSLNHRVRKVDKQGIITTFAGTGTAGFSGDDGPASRAQLSAPSGLTFDSAGSLYIVDSSIAFNCTVSTEECNAIPGITNQRIRKVDPNGTITTVAGNGHGSYSGDGGPATSAALCFPFAVTVDGAGNLFILDAGNDVVRMVDNTGTISTLYFVGANGRVLFPLSVDDYAKEGGGISADANGNLLIATWEGEVVYRASKVSTAYFSGAVNAANFSAAPGSQAAPGSLLTVFGLNLTAGSVNIAGTSATLLYGSPSQINLQVPFETPLGNTAVTVQTAYGAAITGQIAVTASAPAIFRGGGDKLNTGAILRSDGQVISYDTPAHPGDYISIYCNGLGDVTNRPADGTPAPGGPPYSTTFLTPNVLIGGVPATVTFSGLAPGYVGLYQVNVQVPANAPAGNTVPVVLSAGSASDTVTMTVR